MASTHERAALRARFAHRTRHLGQRPRLVLSVLLGILAYLVLPPSAKGRGCLWPSTLRLSPRPGRAEPDYRDFLPLQLLGGAPWCARGPACRGLRLTNRISARAVRAPFALTVLRPERACGVRRPQTCPLPLQRLETATSAPRILQSTSTTICVVRNHLKYNERWFGDSPSRSAI
jgi:hypothetical protein